MVVPSLLPAAFPPALCQPRGHLLFPLNLPQNVGSTSSNRRVAALLFGQDSSHQRLGSQSPRCQVNLLEVCPLPFISCRKEEKPCWGRGLLVAWEQGRRKLRGAERHSLPHLRKNLSYLCSQGYLAACG